LNSFNGNSVALIMGMSSRPKKWVGLPILLTSYISNPSRIGPIKVFFFSAMSIWG